VEAVLFLQNINTNFSISI